LKFIHSTWQKIKKIEYKPWHFPVILLSLMLAAYGLLINRLGFYWDDWTQLLVSRLYDNHAYWAYFASDRPTSAWTHILFVPLFGFKPLYWQIFTLFLRWFTVVMMWYTLGLLWPKRKRTIAGAALLFAVYPAFIQQAPSVAFHQHWLQFAIYFASLACMIHSIRDGKLRWGWMITSLLLEGIQISITEFYAGIELIRPVILWILLSQESGLLKRVKRTFFVWLPYFGLLAGFTIWRLFFSNLTKNSPSLLYTLISNPIATVINLLRMIVEDQIYIVISSWGRVFNMQTGTYADSLILFSWVIVFALVLFLWGYFATIPDYESEDKYSVKEMIWIGALVTLVGPAPIWLTGKNMLVDNDFHVDRFAMASMWGISLVIVVLVEILIQNWKKAALAISIVIALTAGLQIRVAGEYSRIWENQRSFYWQLLWRAPYIEPGTALVSEDTILAHQELFSTGSAINHLYPQSSENYQLAYWMYRLSPTYDEIGPDENPSFNTIHRIYHFSSNLNDSVVIQYNPEVSACLWVLSPVDANNPEVADIVQQAAVHSNLSRIEVEAAVTGTYPPVDMIGKEPTHDWCYIYQKAELAMQLDQPLEVLSLLDQAEDMGYRPADELTHAREWVPMMEALIAEGKYDRAGAIAQTLISNDVNERTMICSLWNTEPDDMNVVNWIHQLNCKFE
jgi:hypothetical protein